ncbi:TIGR03087 family PEP-CTERM/XrtA system glycosyltransferase [Kordiimonas aquimaris]|uniref:TIGR03087 family PEP-CTERM/XrtA system glycosyltransferase n=1 Tax=Kordiimonas aquimaris TaxID=707591 RepID=UPI0021D31D81|nr:TIGR03087 family PEP-CTERM/XrtA system glycosyltransferase [Kordiimonas aquimaris]
MARILFLSHRIPYPPNKGDKIRSWNFLKHLLCKNEVHLGFFIDDKADVKHISFLQEQCASVMYAFASPLKQKLSAIKGFVTDKSLTECAYPSKKIRQDIKSLIFTKKFDLIFVYSAAPFAWLPSQVDDVPIITDLVDVDSAKWEAYAAGASIPIRWIYNREAKYLSRFEAFVASKSKACSLVSNDEAALFKKRMPLNLQKTTQVYGITNGVDCAAFNPRIQNETGAKQNISTRLIFTGAMDYRPNIEAVKWFTKHVLPKLFDHDSSIEFIIAGAPVAPEVKELSHHAYINVLGRVDNMADEINSADIVVAPLQTARGIQNKVLEGMAMAKPVIATSAANEGINAPDNEAIIIADTAEAYVAAINNLLADPKQSAVIGKNARKFVEQHFSWSASWSALDNMINSARTQEENTA